MAWAYAAGTAGTVTLPVGARLLGIRCESHSAAATVAIFGGTAIVVDGGTAPASHMIGQWNFRDGPEVYPSTDRTVVFANTVSYFVEYSTSPGT